MKRKPIKVRTDKEPITMKGTKVTLIGLRENLGHLTGLKKEGRRCELWQVYWTKVRYGANNTSQWVPCDQILFIGHN
jgi:hypothetical protein